MATKSTKQQIYLVVHESRDHGYFKLQAHVCEQRYEDHQWLPRFIDDANGVRVGSLQVSCQGDERTQLRDRDDAVYGYACEYREPYAIDLRTAEAMAKTLRIVNNRLNTNIAKIMPVYVAAIPGLILVLVQLYREATDWEGRRGGSGGGIEMDEVREVTLDKKVEFRRTL